MMYAKWDNGCMLVVLLNVWSKFDFFTPTIVVVLVLYLKVWWLNALPWSLGLAAILPLPKGLYRKQVFTF